MAELKGNKYGTHRVIEPKGVLTQAAWKVDNDMSKVYSNEIVCDVTSLNIDSASFTQISDACGGDEKKIGEMILGIVAERGKQQNPVTGSGGMFKGVVAHIGEDLKKKPGFDLKEGDKIVTSNISDIFLPGILIGYASGLTTDANNVTKSGTIIPVADFDNLQEVLVITQLKNGDGGDNNAEAAD